MDGIKIVDAYVELDPKTGDRFVAVEMSDGSMAYLDAQDVEQFAEEDV